jgi:hypothetical protein
MARPVHLFACSCAARHVHQVAEALEMHTLGDERIAAVQIGGATVHLAAERDRMRRHERQHDVQAAQYAPSWAAWLPLFVRAWLGADAFHRDYLRLYTEHGFITHPFERDAREAEDPTVPGVRPPRAPLL